jgi:hypothetical protein
MRTVSAFATLPFVNLALVTLALASVSACHTLPKNHTMRSSVDLAARGEASARFASQGTDRVHVVVENRGPGALEFSVTDDKGRTLESGVIGKVRRNFTWRPIESFVTFSVKAPQQATSFDYRVASESSFSVEWNLTHALAPRK